MSEKRKTDLEKVRIKLLKRKEESGNFDRLRLYIEIKEMVRFLEDVYKSTMIIVDKNVLDFFDQNELFKLYESLLSISLNSAESIIDFDNLLGVKRKEYFEKLKKEEESVEDVDDEEEDTELIWDIDREAYVI